jgi:hypothetical protein
MPPVAPLVGYIAAVHRLLFVIHAALAGGAAGCSDDMPRCITVEPACSPLYTPTFDNVYDMTLKNGCGSTLASCHSRAGQAGAGGLSFEDAATAHAQLLLSDRVKPGDAACSEMIVRVGSPGKDFEMPPGAPLSPAARCALVQWVENGAKGPGEPFP